MKKLITKILLLITLLSLPLFSYADDNDNDGIDDQIIDKCLNTQTGTVVDSDGCSDSQKDTDNDTIMDDKDKCPNTNNDSFIDTDGCSNTQKLIDTDGDGIKDYIDDDIDGDGLNNTKEKEGWSLNYIGPSGITLTQKVISDIYLSDTDGDGINDIDEKSKGLNPNLKDSDFDGINDEKDKELTHFAFRKYIDDDGIYNQNIYDGKDDDGDGIKNNNDKCGGSKIGIEVNSEGCSKVQTKLLENDKDLDGIKDNNDDDNNTPYLLKPYIDSKGKAIDSLLIGNYGPGFYGNTSGYDNIRITTESSGKSVNNEQFERMGEKGDFFAADTGGEKGLKGFLLNIARDIKIIAFALVLLLVIIMVIKLLFAENTEEQQKKLKMGILWSTIGIMVMQVAFSVYKVMFDKDVGATLARDFSKKIVEPFTELLMLLASFVFIMMAIYAFYKIVTAGGNEEGIKKGKMTIFQAIIGFIVIKFSSVLVKNTFNPDCGSGGIISYWGTTVCENVKSNSLIIISIINWINTFLAIVVVIMIIYAGFLVMTGGGEEEKNKKAKKIILYSAIGLLILFASYMILTFFIIPESTI